MALIIENGSTPANANSYATVAQARAFALARGLTLPADDGAVEVLLVKGADYINSLEYRFKGERSSSTQSLAWPRSGVYLFSATSEIGNVIPSQLIQAQCQLAVEAVSVDLLPNGDGKEVIMEKVDVLETQYAPKGVTVSRPTFSKVNAFLTPLFKFGIKITTIRG